MSETPLVPGELAVGSQVAGYQIERQIGRGGMAVVYRAFDPRLGRSVALKILAPELASDAAFRERFNREMRAAAAVDHPHIVPVYDAGEASGSLFIAMRYVAGQDLRTLLDREGALSPSRVTRIVSQVASALDEAHSRGMVHRDVKPGNMLIGTVAGSGQPDHVYLSDFGLSKQSLSTSNLTVTGQFLGTLDYMAPEQVEGRPIDGRADLYALACSAFEMLAGRPPFKREESVAVLWAQVSAPTPSLRALRPELPPAVDQVMARAMAKAPGDRYQSCTAFAGALREACGLGAGEAEAAGRGEAAGWQPTEMAHVAGQAPPTAWPGPAAPAPPTAWPSDPQPASYQSGQTDPPPGAPTSYPAGPQPGQHPSWPDAPPSRYVVSPPAPSRYTADAVAPRRRRSWMGALLIVAVILLLGMAGALFALLRGHNSSTTPPASTSSAPSSPANKTSSAPPTTSPVNPAAGPRATVEAYFAAINARDYRKAWNLGGSNTGRSYQQFVQGFNGTQQDTLTIQSVSGNVVTAGLSALQADGTVKTFQGTYTVNNGVITSFDVKRTS
ncbi:MAG TPA: serine/threonine-protein kinase [Streptosporangiaceae bacterium]|nr:serine/threonine-protein kinase [Streptosporangiaceae bacterium]